VSFLGAEVLAFLRLGMYFFGRGGAKSLLGDRVDASSVFDVSSRLMRLRMATNKGAVEGASLVQQFYPRKYCINMFSSMCCIVVLSVSPSMCFMIIAPMTNRPLIGAKLLQKFDGF
jgi:hypothetical protein